MQPAEMVWRAHQAMRLPLSWAQARDVETRISPPDLTGLQIDYPVRLHSDGGPIESISIFDLEFPNGFDFDWHRDYKYDKQVEAGFSPLLNIRNMAVVGDIKYIWEVNRTNTSRHWPTPKTPRAMPHTSFVRWPHGWNRIDICVALTGRAAWNWLCVLFPGRCYTHASRRCCNRLALQERWLNAIYLHLAASRRVRVDIHRRTTTANWRTCGVVTSGRSSSTMVRKRGLDCNRTAGAGKRNYLADMALTDNREQAMSLSSVYSGTIFAGLRRRQELRPKFHDCYSKRLQAMLGILGRGGNAGWRSTVGW